MKKNITMITAVFAVLIVAIAIPSNVAAEGKTKAFALNPEVGPPTLEFISNAPMEDIEGNTDADVIKASLSFDPKSPEKATGSVSFKVSGMKTGIDLRDEHMRSDVWLDAEKYPEIAFSLTELKNVITLSVADGKTEFSAIAVGNFKMKGKSKKLDSKIKITYLEQSAATQKKAKGDLIMVSGELSVKLADYDVKGKSGVIGSKVGDIIKINYKLFFSTKY